MNRRGFCAAFGLYFCLFVQVSVGVHERKLTAIALLGALLSWGILVREAMAGRFSIRFSIALSVLALIMCVAFPPATSKDVNSYALYGRMVSTYGKSPYTHTPRDFPGDPWFPKVSYYWIDARSVYGPLFTGVSGAVMAVAGRSPTAARLGFQLLSASGLAAAVGLAWWRRRDATAVVLLGANPLLLSFAVNDAHCDVLVGAAILAAALALERRRFVAGGVLVGMAVLVKVSALPAMVGMAAWAWRRHGLAAALRAAVSAAVVGGVGLVLAGALDVWAALHEASLRSTRFSIWRPVYWLISTAVGQEPPTQSIADVVVSLGSTLLVAVVAVWLIWRHRQNAEPFVALAAGLIAYQILGAYTVAWYAAWSLPVLAMAVTSNGMLLNGLKGLNGLNGLNGSIWRCRIALLALAHGTLTALAYLDGYVTLAVLLLAGAAGVVLVGNRRILAAP